MAVAGSDPGLLEPLSAADEEALFREARRLRRRRWIRRAAVVVAVGCVGSATIVLALSGGTRTPRSGGETAGALPNGPFASLKLAGALAVAPDGALYVAAGGMPGFTATKADRVLVRLSDGRFRVVAGDGHRGFSGDGGQAVDAELSDVSDITFAPNGTMYIADGHRIRTVSPEGVIRTIAGNGRAIHDIADSTSSRQLMIANGTPALSAPLGFVNPLYIALDPSTGQLYISTGNGQILRLTRSGRIDTVRAIVPSGIGKGPFMGDGPLAIDKQGNIDITGGPRGWSAWQIAPDGIATYLGFARMPGGDNPIVQPGPNGAIYVGLNRVQHDRLITRGPRLGGTGMINGQYFPNTYFAFAPNGTLYVDDLPGATGFQLHQQLRAISHGHATLLWQEPNPVPN